MESVMVLTLDVHLQSQYLDVHLQSQRRGLQHEVVTLMTLRPHGVAVPVEVVVTEVSVAQM